MLPSIFAIFDRSAGEPDHGRRFYDHRYAICEWEIDASNALHLRPWHTEAQRRNRWNVVEHMDPIKIEQFLPGQYFWNSRYNLEHRETGQVIPILDFSRIGFRQSLTYPFTAENDTLEYCVRRQSGARQLFNRVIDQIRVNEESQISPPIQIDYPLRSVEGRAPTPMQVDEPVQPPPMAPSTIPRFVAELIKQKAIDSGDACPISMNPFTKEAACSLTSCYHLFEKNPLRTWLAKPGSSCPTCKQAVRFMVDVV